ncbi:MAG: hypothetical protein P4L26_16270 [Terracidiphilus sp.]|nr:hypothetical protein [Terracidiphilus sp.]
MGKQNENLRDRLLARLPQPENLAGYREETAALLAKHEKALFWERMLPLIFSGGALCVIVLTGSFLGPPANNVKTAFLILFFLSMIYTLSYNVSRSKVDLLKEIKQVQLQLLELQASLRKDEGR